MKDRRLDFSIYRKNEYITYLDYAATTFMPDRVINSWMDYQQTIGVGCNRGDGMLSEMAQEEYDRSKERILDFFDANPGYDMLFGKNATECLNLLSYSIRNILAPGDIILMGPYEHHSNILPWEVVAKHTGACLVQIPLLETGEINYDFINNLDIKRIKVVSMSAISNVNAHMLDVDWFKKLISECNAFSILDVSQAVGHRKLSFVEIDADAYVMSAHKMYGPKNIGAAIVKKERIDSMSPFIVGGGMVWNALGATPKWHIGARKFEAGTFDVGLIKAWSEACEYLNEVGMDKVCQSDKEIWEFTKKRMNNKRIRIVPGGDDFSSICSFYIDGFHPHDIVEIAAIHNFEIRTGHMCAQTTLDNFGFTSLCRISWGIGSVKEDVEKFICLLEEEL